MTRSQLAAVYEALHHVAHGSTVFLAICGDGSGSLVRWDGRSVVRLERAFRDFGELVAAMKEMGVDVDAELTP